ncbi:MAG TPA: ABC transporter ATP-binding protein [Aromatoleum sp.]|uniref:ABC transporter ATP-binding protein n=1 Tax=Aromatoleum sp. TaxID=2307007 RepID=UPI002B49BFAE|nr:ABC transporter ATP-binding protein [Aromatoleum sp.]HJV25550.1 ABC transporter ATP-binding protein [Aromatoleum sp.]
MIELNEISKTYTTQSGRHHVLDHISLTIQRGDKLGILGRNGAGKSTLIRILSGIEPPTSGRVTRRMTISWPLAFAGGFQGSLTGIDNFKFISRVYGIDYRSKLDFVDDFSELGKFMREPVKRYSSGMRARLAFAISMAIEFDCYLIDEVSAVGDSRFREKCENELFLKRGDRTMIIVSHQPEQIRQHCNRFCVLEKGKIINFDKADSAYDYYAQWQ